MEKYFHISVFLSKLAKIFCDRYVSPLCFSGSVVRVIYGYHSHPDYSTTFIYFFNNLNFHALSFSATGNFIMCICVCCTLYENEINFARKGEGCIKPIVLFFQNKKHQRI